MKPSQYLDALREKLGVQSDYAVSLRMGWTRQLASNYRNNRNTFDNTTCAQIAEALGVTFDEIVADMEKQRAKTEAQREFWENFASRLKGAAAGVFLTVAVSSVTMLVTSGNAEAATALPAQQGSKIGVCIMSNYLVKLWRRRQIKVK